MVAAASSASAHPSPARPYDRARVQQGLTGGLWTSVRAHWPAGISLPDPTAAAVRVWLTVEPGGAPPRVIELPPSGWTARRGFRFAASGCGGRIVRARLRAGRGGGRFALDLPDCAMPLVGPEATRVAILVTAGDVRWCADIVALRAGKRRITGATHASLATCPCEPLPADTFEAIERRIFARHGCGVLGCHGGVLGQADLSLAPGLAYANLVSVASTTDPTRVRVAPGDPEHSFLWQKVAVRTLGLDDIPGLGMPIGDPPLDVDELDALGLWIAAGAPATGTIAEAQALLACPQ